MEKEVLQHKGRPRKKPVRLRNRHACTYLTPTEKLLLEAKAREAGMSESEWLRAAIRQREVAARLKPREATFVRHLTTLSNHVDQILSYLQEQRVTALEQAGQRAKEEMDQLLLYLDCDAR
ncbi:hypothetical protein POKO110462_10265 [Pontibacter korlensis]|uniref:Uncharacterized protein n=1 Tax=Pontibacter korlensis TaxID=400092 RepID=A0A0E3ZBC5_9BACT|nr:hypothetical protein [Pontibacter korlensis]AKD01918.1 hypothetical protein PKOR_00605 [Pontibacter korlensis]